MKLVDIKKLKVPDLRSKLRELGLDPGGLKAELVGRLWSFHEARTDAEVEETTNINPQYDTSTDKKETVDLRAAATPPTSPESYSVAGVTPRCDVVPTKEFTDTATQTETESSASTAQQTPEIISTCVLMHQPQDGDAELEQGGAAGGPGVEERVRGRAFYEFKEEIRYKRAKSPQPPVEREDAEKKNEDVVQFNPYDGHLHFEVTPDGMCGQPRYCAQFPSLWSGCRLTHGVVRGCVGFEVRMERVPLSQHLKLQPEDVDSPGLRVGWSVAGSSTMLGEDDLSFAYDALGKKVSSGIEEDFGEPLSVGDIIGCYASFSTDAVELSFSKNGHFTGVAFSVATGALAGRTLFPHVLCKSCLVRVHLDPTSPPWYPGPDGFTPLAALHKEQRVAASSGPASRLHCEVVLMVGLPGSGKSFWAKNHMKQHPEKHYRLLGTEEILACLIRGRQSDSRLQQASHCLTDLIKIAAHTPGNYILDQCNILFSARRHKLKLFSGFRRKAVVVFPSAEEWRRRLFKHQTTGGELIPETALLKLQVSCSFPEQESDLLDQLQYVELPPEKALKLLQEYKDEAHRLLPPNSKPEKRGRLNKKRPYSHGPPASHRIQWAGSNGTTQDHRGGSSQLAGMCPTRTRASAAQTLATLIIKSTGEDKETDADCTTRDPQDSLAPLSFELESQRFQLQEPTVF